MVTDKSEVRHYPWNSRTSRGSKRIVIDRFWLVAAVEPAAAKVHSLQKLTLLSCGALVRSRPNAAIRLTTWVQTKALTPYIRGLALRSGIGPVF